MIKPDSVELLVNNTLLNPSFNGYKLSLDALPIFDTNLPFKVAEFKASEEQFSLHHTKIIAQSSALFFDSFHSTDDQAIFFIVGQDYSIYRFIFSQSKRTWNKAEKVATFSRDDSNMSYPPSLYFCSKDLAILSTGSGKLIFYHTETDRILWKEISSFEDSGIPYFFTVECRLRDEEIYALLQVVAHKDNIAEETASTYVNRYHSITFRQSDLSVKEKHEFWCTGPVEVATYSSDCKSVVILTSARPMCEGQTSGSKTSNEYRNFGDESSKPLYIWTEKDDEVNVIMKLEEKVTKEDIKFNITDSFLKLEICNDVLLEGPLGGSVRASEALWTLDAENLLEITLTKLVSTSMWNCFIAGDTRGKFELDPELLSTAQDLLQKFTSDSAALGNSGASSNFNSDQLEECDMSDEQFLSIYWYTLREERVTKQCDVTGNQFLFSSQPFCNEATRLCLRYDVDGILISGDGPQLDHVATFNALGYVQASKSLRRWTDCSPDHSYAVIAEGKNHLFLYWQMDKINSDLRNRKTLQKVSSVAKQQVISLRNRHDPSLLDTSVVDYTILAIRPLNNVLVFLTGDRLYSVFLQ